MNVRGLIHSNPIWRKRANYIIGIWLPPVQGRPGQEWEQLWSRQIADNRFEICCIPLYAYDLALGDEVETATIMGQPNMINSVVEKSGHWTLRAWFEDSSNSLAHTEVEAELKKLGCLIERGPKDLLGIDAPSDQQAQQAVQLLSMREQLGHLTFETGWT